MHDGGLEPAPLAERAMPADPGVESETTHAPAAPDVPKGIGYCVIGAFGVVVLSFMGFFSGSAQSRFMTAVTLCFLVVYFAVPVILFMIQPKPMRKLTWSQFSLKGLFIRTGHVNGREAVLQILTLPICLMIAAIAMGLAWTFDH